MFLNNPGATRVGLTVIILCFAHCHDLLYDDLEESEPEGEAEISPSTETILADNVYVVGDQQASAARLESNHIIFPLAGNDILLQLEEGDIVIAGPAADGTGFLRKILAVEQISEEIIIDTQPAALTDAVTRGKLSDTLNFRNTRRSGIGEHDSITMGVSIGGVVLFEDPELAVRVTRGRAMFDPFLDFDIDIEGARLREFTATAQGEFEAELAIEVAAAGTVAISRGGTLWQSQPYVFMQFIGIVPVVEVITFSLYTGFEIDMRTASVVEAGMTAQSEVTLGAQYENGDWQAVASHDFELRPIAPSFDRIITARVRGYIEPRFNVLFYGTVGPTLSLRPYLQLAAIDTPPPPSWNLSAGLIGRINVNISILDSSALNFSAELFNFERALMQWVESEGEGEGEAEEENWECQLCLKGSCNKDDLCASSACCAEQCPGVCACEPCPAECQDRCGCLRNTSTCVRTEGCIWNYNRCVTGTCAIIESPAEWECTINGCSWECVEWNRTGTVECMDYDCRE